ncbi:MAG: stage III sporulation protein AE [Clostridiales bacterium]|nr:stage III sporulation protein AE [Clostridiales bacterium]
MKIKMRAYRRLPAILLLSVLLLLFISTGAEAAEAGANIEEQLDLAHLEDYIGMLDGGLSGHLDDFSLKGLWKQAKDGKISLNLAGLLKVLGSLLFGEVLASASLMAQLAVLSIVCLLLNNLAAAFGKGNVSALARSVGYLLLIGIAIGSFTLAVGEARKAIEMCSGFLYAALPVMMTLLAAMGGISSVSIVHPAMLLAVSLSVELLAKIIFPLIYFSAVLRLVSHISPRFNVDKMAGLFKDLSLGVMGVMMTLFLAFISISGLAAASLDGLAVKAAKTAAGAFIPVVGKTLADVLDTVVGTSLVLKNGIGVVGVIAIILFCALPAVKILAMALVYRLTASLVQPLGDSRLAEALNGLGGAMQLLFAAVAISGVFFFLLLALTVGLGNVTMMLR